jgi:hypothetical protein
VIPNKTGCDARRHPAALRSPGLLGVASSLDDRGRMPLPQKKTGRTINSNESSRCLLFNAQTKKSSTTIASRM